jgi:hypothetical protein
VSFVSWIAVVVIDFGVRNRATRRVASD